MTPQQRWVNELLAEMERQGHTTLTGLARAVGVDKETIRKWVHTARVPEYQSALIVAEALASERLTKLAIAMHTKTCALEGCEMTFIDPSRSRRAIYCSPRHRATSRRRQRIVAYRSLQTRTVRRYQETIDAFCRGCGITACPDATCVIQVAGLSPLPLANRRLMGRGAA